MDAEAVSSSPLLGPLVIQRCPHRWPTESPVCERAQLSLMKPLMGGEQFFSQVTS